MSTIISNFANLLKQVEQDLLGPLISKEEFDVLIKMAEGFHALAEKGYPGSSELLNEIFTLMGERFHIQFKEDDEELLELQGLFIQGFKDRAFYEKKLKQFTRSAVIIQPKDKEGEAKKTEIPVIKSVGAELQRNPKKFNLKRVEEANQANARSRFDAIKKKFNEKLDNPTFREGLDANGVGLITVIATSIDSLERLEEARIGLNVGSGVLGATEKRNSIIKSGSLLSRIIMRILRHVVKKAVSVPMSKSKKDIDRSIDTIKTSTNTYLPTKKQFSKAEVKKEPSYLDMFLQYIYPTEDQANKSPKDIGDLVKKSQEQMENETFKVFKKSLETLNLLSKKELITSKEWLNTIEKTNGLNKDILDLESKIKAAEIACDKFKKENNEEGYLEKANEFEELKHQKTELFKNVLEQLKQFSKTPIPKSDVELAGLSKIVGFAVIKINKFYHIQAAVIEAYRQFTEAQQVYTDPFKKFTANDKPSETNLSIFESLKERFLDFLKQKGLKEALEANVSKASIGMQLKFLDDFSDKLKQELTEIPENIEPEIESLLETDVDILENLNGEIEILEGMNIEIAKKVEEIEKPNDQPPTAQAIWGFLQNLVQGVMGALIENKDPATLLADELRDNNSRIEKLKKIKSAISDEKGELALEADEYEKITVLHSLFVSLENLNNENSLEPEDELKKQALQREINNQLNAIIKKFTWKNLSTESEINFEKKLKFGNAVLTYLEQHPDPNVEKPEQLKKLEKNLKEKVTFYELMRKNSNAFNFKEISNTLFNSSVSHTGCTVLERYQKEQENSPQLLKNIQQFSREEDIEFLEKIILLLSEDQTMLDTNKMSVFLGALNYLDNELEANAFTSGVNNFKQMIHKIREDTYSTMQLRLKNIPIDQSYELRHALEKGSEDALRKFVNKHQEEFENTPQAQKMLLPKQKPLLYHKEHVENRSKLQRKESAKKNKFKPNPNA